MTIEEKKIEQKRRELKSAIKDRVELFIHCKYGSVELDAVTVPLRKVQEWIASFAVLETAGIPALLAAKERAEKMLERYEAMMSHCQQIQTDIPRMDSQFPAMNPWTLYRLLDREKWNLGTPKYGTYDSPLEAYTALK